MSRHGIDAFGRPIAPDAFAHTFPGVLRRAGYWTGYVGKYGIGPARPGDFDFLRAYEGTHLMTTSNGERIHVTERNARDAIDFLRARPKNQSFSLTVGFFAAHAQDNAPEQYLPQEWSAKAYEGVRIPPPLRGDPEYMAALPPFLANEANEGRVRYHWRFKMYFGMRHIGLGSDGGGGLPDRFQGWDDIGDVGLLTDAMRAGGLGASEISAFMGLNFL